MNRVLIIAADSLLADYYTQILTNLGFKAQSANTIDAGIVAAWDLQPELVLIDPVFSDSIPDPIQRIRAGGRLTTTPFLAMVPLPEMMVVPLSRIGVKIAASRPGETVSQVFEAIEQLLGTKIDQKKLYDLVIQKRWTALTLHKASQAVASLRIASHGLVKAGYSPATLQALFFEAHYLSQCTEIARLPALLKFTSALERLLFIIKEQPSHLNPSILRTISQAIDFLEILFLPNNVGRISDPKDAQIFAVDDDPNLLKLIKDALSGFGLETTGITDPCVALEMIKAGLYNLIFLDVGMPGMNGFELCKQIRALPAYGHVPIVFVTGMATFTNQVQSKIHGGSDFIGKPFNVVELGLKTLMWVFKEQLELI